MSDQKNVSIPAEQLKDILTSVLTEARKPVVTEEEAKAKADAAANRRAMAEQMLEVERNKKILQDNCKHKHWENGKSRGVYVTNGNFIICQMCQKIIRPEAEPELFNDLIQSIAPAIF